MEASDDLADASMPQGDAGPSVVDARASDATNTDGGVPDQRCGPFVATGDQIADSAAGLIWRRTPFSSENFSQATAACAGWGGRLPTEDEVLAFIQAATPCDSVTFPVPPTNQTVWTTTADTQNPTFYETVYFGGTGALPAPESDGADALCVKDAP